MFNTRRENVSVLCHFLWLTAVLHTEPVEHQYAGRSLEDWRALMSRIELKDPDSRRYVPGLIALMDDDSVPWITRRQAALTLGRLGPLAHEAIPHVLSHLDEVHADDPETSPQRWALSSLALFGREAPDAAPQLISLLSDPAQSVVTRLGCLEALSQIGSAAPAAIQALWTELDRQLTHLTDASDHALAIGAAEALGMVGPDAAAAVPVLLRAAQSPAEDLRREAIRAVGRIGSAARDAQPFLCDAMLTDDSELIRDLAATALGQTGPSAWPLIEPLLSAEEWDVRERALTALATWKSAAKEIVPALEPLLQDPEARIRIAAAHSWRRLTDRHDRIWPVLLDLLSDPERVVRRRASQELHEITRAQRISEQELEQLLHDPRRAVRTEGLRLQRLQRQRPSLSP